MATTRSTIDCTIPIRALATEPGFEWFSFWSAPGVGAKLVARTCSSASPACSSRCEPAARALVGAGFSLPDSGHLGHCLHRAGRAAGRAGQWPAALGWKSSRSTARRAGSRPSNASVRSMMRENPAERAVSIRAGLFSASLAPADAGNEHPEDRHAARAAVGGHRTVDAGEDLPVPGLKSSLVLVRAAERLDAGAFENRAGRWGNPSRGRAPAGSAAAVRPSRRRRRSIRKSPGPVPSTSRPARSDTSAGPVHARAPRS